jgi:hypothetical protein
MPRQRFHVVPVLKILFLTCPATALAFVLAACGSHTPPKPDAPSLEQRVDALERRLENLEARPEVKPPFRNKAEIQSHIEALEVERAQLQTRYLAPHPEIRTIDRELDILYTQLRMLE